MLRAALSRIAATFRRRRLDEQFDQEVREHLDLLTERYIASGMSPLEAGYAARRQFGGVTQMKEHLRERRALPPVDILIQDLRHAFRQLRKAKWFTASAALTLALGIGASTAVFAVLDNVVLRPLPYAEPGRLMAVRSIHRRGSSIVEFSYPNFFDLRAANRVFDHLVCYRDTGFTLTDSLPAIQVSAEIVSWDLFPLLGIRPELGRGFRPEEEKLGAHVAVLSDSLWKSRYGGDPSILSRTIHVNGHSFTVVGVAPAGFLFPVDSPKTQLWVTVSEDAAASEFTPLTAQRGARFLGAVGRLKAGITPQQAEAQMDQVSVALAQQYPDDNKNVAKTRVGPELERLAGSSKEPILILLGAVGLLLGIACANVANLLLARGTERAREFALRTALGASRGAVMRQLLCESLALGLMGAIGGTALSAIALKLALPLAGNSIPRLAQAAIDARVLVFSALLAIGTSLIFTLAPAFEVLRSDASAALKETATNLARGRNRFRSALVVGQITLGLLLLVGAELLLAGFMQLARRDPGFHADHLLTFDIGLPDQYKVADQIAFYDRMIDRLRAIPGVRSAATGTPLPLEGSQMTVSFDIEERRAAPPDRPRSDMSIVTPGYFGTIGIPILRGRDFTERDDTKSPRVLIVNQAFARKFFPNEDAIGKRIESGATNGKEATVVREVVGIVGDAKQVPLSAASDPIYYFPYKQLSWGIGAIVLRTDVPPHELDSAARAVIADLDPQVPMFRVRSGDELAFVAIAAPRFQTTLMVAFAAIALLLTMAGLYGVLSYAVARRRREIGVRIALGAARREVLRMVLREAAVLVGAGLLLGLAGAFAVERLLSSVVFGSGRGAPILIAGACALMALTGLAAAYRPAARAASVDPVQALRAE